MSMLAATSVIATRLRAQDPQLDSAQAQHRAWEIADALAGAGLLVRPTNAELTAWAHRESVRNQQVLDQAQQVLDQTFPTRLRTRRRQSR